MGFKLIPDFGESDLYIIAVSFLVMFLLYFANSGSINYFITEFNDDPDAVAGVSIFVLALFYSGVILPIKYAFSEKIPNNKMAHLMVHVSLFCTTFISLYVAKYWFDVMLVSGSLIDKIMIIFPIVALLKGVVIVRFLGAKVDYSKYFIFENVGKKTVILSTILIIATGLVIRFFTGYPGLVSFVIMMDIANYGISRFKST